MAVKYRSKKDGKTRTYAQPQPRVERDKRFERVDDKAEAKKTPAAS